MISGFGDRLVNIRGRAEVLEKTADAKTYSAYVATELFDAAKSAPGTQTPVYTRMIWGVAQAVPDKPDVQKALWKTALQVVSAGIPGCASVALAKSVEEVEHQFSTSEFRNSTLQDLNEKTLQLCSHNMGQKSQQACTIAAQGLRDSERFSVGETMLCNAVADVADLEGWRLAAF